jgi:hypothetical protein
VSLSINIGTLIMNGRLLALLGAIALFVCLWRSPEPTPVFPAQVQVARMESLRSDTRLDVPVPLIPALSEPPMAPVMEPCWLGEPLLSELPDELFPGLYRVVSTDGAVGEVLIPGTILGAKPQELVLHRQADVHWYFIRQSERLSEETETASVGREVPLPQPLSPTRGPVPEPIPQPVETDELMIPELNSKDRDIAEAELRQWLKAMSLQVREWVLMRWLRPLRTQGIPLAPRPRFLQFASYQRSAVDPLVVASPRRIPVTIPVVWERHVEPSCACPQLP